MICCKYDIVFSTLETMSRSLIGSFRASTLLVAEGQKSCSNCLPTSSFGNLIQSRAYPEKGPVKQKWKIIFLSEINE